MPYIYMPYMCHTCAHTCAMHLDVPYTCHTRAIHVPYMCHTYAIHICHTYMTYMCPYMCHASGCAIHVPYICHTYMPYMCHTCAHTCAMHLDVPYMCHTCAIHMPYMCPYMCHASGMHGQKYPCIVWVVTLAIKLPNQQTSPELYRHNMIIGQITYIICGTYLTISPHHILGA